MNKKVLMACLWCGPVFAGVFGIAFVFLAGFVPPPSPNDSPAEIVDFYRQDLTALRIGMFAMMAATPLLIPWGVALASQTRRTETGFPVITTIQLISTGIISLTIVIILLLWTVASFRVGDISPETTETLNDLGFFTFLFDWSPFCLWVLSFAVAIFLDERDPPIFPRWAAYLNLWIVLLSIPGGLIVFFKTGPFAYNGFVAFYFPVVVFFIWLVAMTYLTHRAIASQPED